MKRDIIYKLDDTNSAVTIIRGIVGNQGQEIRAIKDQHDGQGQDIKDIKRHVDAIDGKFEQVLQVLTTLKDKAE